jgi:hypothetical protein
VGLYSIELVAYGHGTMLLVEQAKSELGFGIQIGKNRIIDIHDYISPYRHSFVACDSAIVQSVSSTTWYVYFHD